MLKAILLVCFILISAVHTEDCRNDEKKCGSKCIKKEDPCNDDGGDNNNDGCSSDKKKCDGKCIPKSEDCGGSDNTLIYIIVPVVVVVVVIVIIVIIVCVVLRRKRNKKLQAANHVKTAKGRSPNAVAGIKSPSEKVDVPEWSTPEYLEPLPLPKGSSTRSDNGSLSSPPYTEPYDSKLKWNDKDMEEGGYVGIPDKTNEDTYETLKEVKPDNDKESDYVELSPKDSKTEPAKYKGLEGVRTESLRSNHSYDYPSQPYMHMDGTK